MVKVILKTGTSLDRLGRSCEMPGVFAGWFQPHILEITQQQLAGSGHEERQPMQSKPPAGREPRPPTTPSLLR
jgi:hypothetical protein